jgi:hypothetical protein
MRPNTFESQVSSIPCLIEVTFFAYKPPYSRPRWACETPDDLYGYLEVEFSVLDRKGYPAPWLEEKLTDDDVDRINHEALRAHREFNCI